MTEVHLSGQLICSSDTDAAVVAQHLPLHIELTRSEAGCISFEVVSTDNSRVWQVDEWFRDATAFKAHQDRVSTSEWGRATAQIERRYSVEGL